ncbi:MAG TPA: hypothetical protein VK876_10735, partial [Rubrivivax sp.]|nr:hypothetical protein [Rubrivivax sp.]
MGGFLVRGRNSILGQVAWNVLSSISHNSREITNDCDEWCLDAFLCILLTYYFDMFMDATDLRLLEVLQEDASL